MTPQEAQKAFEDWQRAVDALAQWKAYELSLRRIVGEYYFPDARPDGHHTLKLAEGWSLTFDTKMNRTLENKRGETSKVASQLPPEVAEKTIGWKPSLKMTGYKKLTDEQKALVDSVMTSKPGTPTLTLVPPKKES